jgi:heme/copper-type cytochrome/quinol oxidase subunit 3
MITFFKLVINDKFSSHHAPLSSGKVASINYKTRTPEASSDRVKRENLSIYPKTAHPFHIVDPSPWPFIAAFGAFELTFGMALYMSKYSGGKFLLQLGLVTIIYVMYVWWRDVIREALYEEKHTQRVQRGLRLGIALFIVSEAMFFFSFFWAFFYFSGTPAFDPLCSWPPKAALQAKPYGMALLNTYLLLSSGVSLTWAHHAMVKGSKKNVIVALLYTLSFAVFFMNIQYCEYVTLPFSIADGIYGSCFYMLTGFHGFHVFVGTIALFVSLIRTVLNHFTREQHIGFEGAIWYWHFVDVVWLGLFLAIYWWGK